MWESWNYYYSTCISGLIGRWDSRSSTFLKKHRLREAEHVTWGPTPAQVGAVSKTLFFLALEIEETIGFAKQFLRVVRRCPRPLSGATVQWLSHTSYDVDINYNQWVKGHKAFCSKEHVRTEQFADKFVFIRREIWEPLNDIVQITPERQG